jgi:hypothetical protein
MKLQVLYPSLMEVATVTSPAILQNSTTKAML